MASGEAIKGTLARVALPPRPKKTLRPSGSGIRITVYEVVSGKMGSRSMETRRHRRQAADAVRRGCIIWKVSQGNHEHAHRRSCSHGCRWFPHGSAYGTKSSNRRLPAVSVYLVLTDSQIRLASSAVSTLIFRSAEGMRPSCLPR